MSGDVNELLGFPVQDPAPGPAGGTKAEGFDLERSFAALEFFLKHSLDDFLDSLDEAGTPFDEHQAQAAALR